MLLVIVTALLVVCSVSVVLAGFHAPISFDEAYNLQVPLHLAHEGRYATDGALYNGQTRLFDAFITTGPTMLLPTAAAVWLFGDHLWVIRLAPTAYFLLLLVLASALGRRSAGRWGACAAAASVLAVNLASTQPESSVFGSGDLVGEVACAVFVLWAAANLDHSRRAGFAFGLAVLTKLLSFIMAPAFVLVLLLAGDRRLRTRIGTVVKFVAWASIPVLVWNVVRLLALGVHDFSVRTEEFLSVFLNSGSGFAPSAASSLMDRLVVVSTVVQSPALLLIGPVLALTAMAAVSSLASRRSNRPLTPVLGLSRTEIAGIGGAVLLFAWWVLIADRAWARHLLIGAYVALPLFTCSLLRVAERRGLTAAGVRRLLGEATVVVLIAAAMTTAVRAWFPDYPATQSEQRVVAAAVVDTGATHISVLGWAQVPEIAYLSGTRARPLEDEGGLLVVQAAFEAPEVAVMTAVHDRCGREVDRRYGYLICKVPPRP